LRRCNDRAPIKMKEETVFLEELKKLTP